MVATATPQRASISLSASTNSRPSRAASRRPTVVLPQPIMPTRMMGRLEAMSADMEAVRGGG